MVESEVNLFPVCCSYQEQLVPVTLAHRWWHLHNNYYTLHFLHDDWGHLVASCWNIFDALCRLRGVLESRGWLICCNGSRSDAWISSMGKDMGGGQKVYVAPLGEMRTPKHLVRTLAPAEPEQCTTLIAQRDYHRDWWRSLGQTIVVDFPEDWSQKIKPGEKPDFEVPSRASTESRLRAAGWVYRLADHLAPDAPLSAKSIVGAWKLDQDGNITEPYTLDVPLDREDLWSKVLTEDYAEP